MRLDFSKVFQCIDKYLLSGEHGYGPVRPCQHISRAVSCNRGGMDLRWHVHLVQQNIRISRGTLKRSRRKIWISAGMLRMGGGKCRSIVRRFNGRAGHWKDLAGNLDIRRHVANGRREMPIYRATLQRSCGTLERSRRKFGYPAACWEGAAGNADLSCDASTVARDIGKILQKVRICRGMLGRDRGKSRSSA
jgi:hypothetical protein